ncbi:hypothetical protein HX049_18135 [Myroides odoratimimus]|uniref:hypothetical protein n=1 Tax=Myroides odoratimimus TaxID=76832 RepID=UPI00257592A6|nr:hypothetical protein [Myroides odoratimimus]MDM1399049.1 hypothetical protein [Myroides odoratimimus]
MEKEKFENLTIEQKIQKINNIILHLPYDKKIDVCRSCRHKNGDFKEYDNYIQDGGFCSVCMSYKEVLNYTVIDLVEQADISIHDYFAYHAPNGEIYSGIRKTLSRIDIDMIKIEYEMERKKGMTEEHIKLASAYGIDESTLTPINKITAKYLKMTYLFSGLFLGVLVSLILYSCRNLAYFSTIWNGLLGLIIFILFIDAIYSFIMQSKIKQNTNYILVRGVFNILIWLLIHYAIGRVFEFNL